MTGYPAYLIWTDIDVENKFIINVCLTGVMASRKINPFVPITPEQIATDVRECMELGASIFHIHARDSEGNPDWRTETYQRIISAVRDVSEDAIVCVTTTGRKVSDIEKRIASLDTDPRPDMASLSVGSFNFLNDASVNSPETIKIIAKAMEERGIRPEVEVFDIGMARVMARMLDEGILKPPLYANIILGNAGTADATLLDTAAILHHLPKSVVWCVGGIGKAQLSASTLGLLYAKGVRVGLEDNVYMDVRGTPARNALLVERVVRIARALDKTPYSISDTRKLLGLQ
jgi:3-keto-5-aminohexanoate cleavage enzyme